MVISRKPRKKRQAVANAKMHLRRKLIKCTLSKELREKYNRRNITPRKGDEVKVMRGKYKGKTGKVIKVSYSLGKVGIDSITRKRKNGKEVPILLQPSNLMITSLDESDKRRRVMLKK